MLSPDPAIPGKRGRFLPIRSRQWQMEGNDSHRPGFWIPGLPQRTVGSQTQLNPVSDPGLAQSPRSVLQARGCFVSPSSALVSPAPPLPAYVWRAGLLFCPLLLQPACSFSFKEFKGWLPRSVLQASVCFLYSVLVGSSHWLYIWVPFPVFTFVDGSQGPLLVELFGLWMALPRQNRGVGINFNLFFNRKRPKNPTYKIIKTKQQKAHIPQKQREKKSF